MNFLLFSGCLIGTVIIFICMTFFRQALDIIFPLNELRPKSFPVPVYYFVNNPEDYFVFICIHLAFGGVLSTFMVIAAESSFGTFTEHACGLFKILG